ncbi:sugar ABC transporter ATP-binding protein [Devosia yakushimensis]|uniref:Sugar ABC transporter ATP-binding protein n=1 Tax=Devosia yakushimensis TaxID=470028 RepID=A0ABQ5UHL7_9HYPH|nr:ABC transporter ATP-binding protein [Devosia yakushimensis]GLQ11584.1 sugar ABC transporter ATP-binding protein [Devosia yakushimensis]
MAGLDLAHVSKAYGAFEAVKDVSLTIEEGEFAVFVGPSGCGKSTLLRLIAGLDPVSDGKIAIGADDVTRRPAGTRSVAMVFQSYALYPHMSVFDNIAFPLQMERRSKDDIRQQVEKAANIVQLGTRLGDKPAKLSGGQRQRVAIARAIVRKPAIFLMDEPLSNLDAALRMEMRTELTRLHKQLGATMVYVTHDQLEAMTMADRIVVLNGGRVEQVGRPMDIYHKPVNRFVAGFIGSPPMNMLAATVLGADGKSVQIAADGVDPIALVHDGAVFAKGAAVTLGIRPEFFSASPLADAVKLTVVPHTVERLGLHTIIHAALGSHAITALLNGDPPIKADVPLDLYAAIEQLHLFDGDGQRRSV